MSTQTQQQATASKSLEELGIPRIFKAPKSGEEGVGWCAWENLGAFKDKTGAFVDLTEHLKNENNSEHELDGIHYSVWVTPENKTLVYARTKDAYGRFLAKKAGGGAKGGGGKSWGNYTPKKLTSFKFAYSESDVNDLIKDGYQPYNGSDFDKSTKVVSVNGEQVIAIAMAKRE